MNSEALFDDEQELLERLRAGDEQVVSQWYKAYHDRLYQVVVNRVSNHQDAEEVVGQIFMNCLRHLNLFRGEASIWTWMWSIARHEIADYHRKRYAKKALRTIPLTEFLLKEAQETWGVEDAHQLSVRVKDVLKRLTGYQQELLLLKYVDRKTVKKIASDFGKTVKAIESELFRARNRFRECWSLDY